MTGFSQKNFPASLLQKYVFLVPFSMRINTIDFQSLYFKIKLNYLGHFKYDFRAFTVPLIPVHSFVSLRFVCPTLCGSTSCDVMSAQRYWVSVYLPVFNNKFAPSVADLLREETSTAVIHAKLQVLKPDY